MNTFKKHSQTLLFCGLLLGIAACQSSKTKVRRQYGILHILEFDIYNANRSSDQALEALKRDVKKNGGSREGIERIKRAELLKKKTTQIVDYINKTKQHLVNNAGQGLDPKTHYPKDPLNTGSTQRLMRQKADTLASKLDTHVVWLSKEFIDLDLPKFEPLTKVYQKLSFYQAFFAHAHLGEVLSTLTTFQATVLCYQSEVLKKLGAGDLSSDLKFDRRAAFRNAFPEGERYATIYENQFYQAGQNPLSTFSIDVDNASYSNVRRFVNDGQPLPKNVVRVEEMINYFDYDYPQPTPTKGKDNKLQTHPFSVNTEYGTCPWNPRHKLLHIGLQGESLQIKNTPPANLVFLVDASGSMDSEDKLPLLKRSFKVLLKQLTDSRTKIAIVAYAGASGLVLPATSISHREKILTALENIESGGSTAGGEGIELAYKIAQQAFIKGGNNRVILATDGDFNVGLSSDEELVQLISKKRQSGVYLTCLGFGTGNLNDSMMEKLTNAGNGNYYYIDGIAEANKVLAKNLNSTLYTIAKDVKIQLEFNPAHVKSYRLVGYENRVLKNSDFKNDKVDAGELGVGHTVTALYEIVPAHRTQPTLDDEIPLKYQTSQIDTYVSPKWESENETCSSPK
ncbi:VWA domain-containing protein [uncultured Microscilla sp.]|uniref:vWA domain-containing protein n=1 Tax=uncultured Microscilla sp. TaxID=432653 RepID=UPI00260252DE|nr:VWA domain-containing protein [uncultured Microscilla sp.]